MTEIEEKKDSEDLYFDSYARTSIHKTMIQDSVRTRTYRNAIFHNKHLFKDKVVMDVGCGTGILSMFAAKAGARRVIGVEKTDFAILANKVVRDNNLQKVVTILYGKVEEVELPDDVDKVDVIVSEWMGYCLFYETMLPSVLFARDKWLVKDGVIFPDVVRLYLIGIKDNEEVENTRKYLETNYTDVNMSALTDLLVKDWHCGVSPDSIITTEVMIKEFDLKTESAKEIDFEAEFCLHATLPGFSPFNGFATYFEAIFSQCHRAVRLTTSPRHPRTHWSQTRFLLGQKFDVSQDEVIGGIFTMTKSNENFRDLNIKINLLHDSGFTEKTTRINRDFKISF